MSPASARRAPGPDPAALAELAALTPTTGGRLQKAPAHDPVLGPPAPTVPAPTVPSAQAPAKEAPSDRRRRSELGDAGAKTKVGFYQDPDDTARARAAYEWTRVHEGSRSFSEFIAAAVMREVARLEIRYHDGRSWPGVEAGQIPTGKPLAGPTVRPPPQP